MKGDIPQLSDPVTPLDVRIDNEGILNFCGLIQPFKKPIKLCGVTTYAGGDCSQCTLI